MKKWCWYVLAVGAGIAAGYSFDLLIGRPFVFLPTLTATAFAVTVVAFLNARRSKRPPTE